MNLKVILISALVANSVVSYGKVTVPKSSLEAVKSEIEAELESAVKQKNPKLIKKYQAELGKIQAKIKTFESEWLGYKKRKLQAKLGQVKPESPVDLSTNTKPTSTQLNNSQLNNTQSSAPKNISTDTTKSEIAEIEELLKTYS